MQIFIARNNQQLGPFDLATIQAQLSDGSLAPTDLAWYEGSAGWAPLSTVPGIVISAPPASAGPPPPPKVTPPAPPRSSPPVPPVATPSVPAPAPIPVIPPIAPAPSVTAFTTPPAQPQKKSALKVVGSILVGILVISLGLLKIVRSTTRLFADKSTTRTYSTPSATQKPSNTAPSPTQKPSTQSIAPQSVGQLKTVSFPAHNPQISFQLPKEAVPQPDSGGTSCFTYGFAVCVSGDPKNSTTFEDSEIKEAEGELTKQLAVKLTQALQKDGGTNVNVNKTGHFKTAKGLLIFYSEATYKSSEGKDMVFLSHMLGSKKGLYVIQGAARQTDKDAFYKEMRRVLDSLIL